MNRKIFFTETLIGILGVILVLFFIAVR